MTTIIRDDLAFNIYHLHPDPSECARYYVDDHVGRGLSECCEMLGDNKSNNQMAVWVRSSYSNWFWTLQLAFYLSQEYTYRFLTIHRAHSKYLNDLMSDETNQQMNSTLPYPSTPFPLLMPD